VTCVSADDCWAAGYSWEPSGNTQPLIEQDLGTGWTVVSGPNPSVSGDSELRGLACVSARDCWAVGQSAQGGLIEHYQGSGWSIASSPTAPSGVSGELYAVTCVSTGDFWAVGGSATGTLIEHYGDGGGWTAVSSPNATDGAKGELQAVTCAGAGDQTLIEHYQGSGWSVVASPNPADGSGPQLNSVSCDGAGDCWAVGRFVDAPGSTRTESPLIERDQGSGWSIAPSPNLSSNSDTQLQAVTCVSAGACWAVGFPSGPNGQVVMHENGQPAG
jgi:hypothetical protein